MSNTDTWVEGSVYYNGSTYYWVDATGNKHTSTSNQSGSQTTSVSIRNIHNDGKNVFDTLIKNNVKGETIVLDGANKVISSSSEGRIFGDDFDFKWIPLYEGINELTFVGNCKVTIEYRTVVKCGEF